MEKNHKTAVIFLTYWSWAQKESTLENKKQTSKQKKQEENKPSQTKTTRAKEEWSDFYLPYYYFQMATTYQSKRWNIIHKKTYTHSELMTYSEEKKNKSTETICEKDVLADILIKDFKSSQNLVWADSDL